jgi:hypothetical protein
MKQAGIVIDQKRFIPVLTYRNEPLFKKLRRRIHSFVVNKIANTPLQFKLYRSYWHRKRNTGALSSAPGNEKHHYLTQVPNHGAGIGHQLANWNSGLYFANFYNLRFAHSQFSTERWENFFGFGEGEVKASDLMKDGKFKVIRLPRFNSLDSREMSLIGEIISSYQEPNILFLLELDQGYMTQCETFETLSHKFFKASARSSDKLIYAADKFNIAIHVRRGDILTTKKLNARVLGNEYYSTILYKVFRAIGTTKNVEVYLFSQGNTFDFPEFESYHNIHYCLDMGAVETVLHLIKADLLIGSKSSFSYKPALISDKIHICPETFWHKYPSRPNYILADNEGNFDEGQLQRQIRSSDKLRFAYN